MQIMEFVVLICFSNRDGIEEMTVFQISTNSVFPDMQEFWKSRLWNTRHGILE